MKIINMLSIQEATIIAEKILIKEKIDCDDNERIIIPSEYIIELPHVWVFTILRRENWQAISCMLLEAIPLYSLIKKMDGYPDFQAIIYRRYD